MNLKQKRVKMIIGASLIMYSIGGFFLGGISQVTAKQYPKCNKAYCAKKSVHKHSGKKYAKHYKGDGHKTHKKCGVKNCNIKKVHKHSGKYYLGHHKSDGHKHHNNSHHGGGHH